MKQNYILSLQCVFVYYKEDLFIKARSMGITIYSSYNNVIVHSIVLKGPCPKSLWKN